MDPSFFTARPGSDEMSVRSPPEYDSPEESFRTAKVMQTPHPNGTSSLASSTEMRSRSVRFASPQAVDERSYSFNFTPNGPVEASIDISQPQIDSSVDIERPRTPTTQQSSAKSSPRKSPNSPLKLFTGKYDTFTNNKMQEMVSNLLPKPDEDDDLTSSRQRKRARREALSRDRVPRVPQNHEIRHARMPSLTTQEMFDDAEDFMRGLRSMPRPLSTEKLRENEVEVSEQTAEAEDLEPTSREEIQFHEEDDYDDHSIEEGDSSEFEGDIHPPQHEEYSQHSSEAYDSIRQAVSPGKLSVFPLSPSKAAQFSQPMANPSSRVSSAESMQVITPDDVSHLLPTTVGSMTFDAAKKAWFKIRPSQMQRPPVQEEDSLPLPPDMNDESEGEEEEEEDIFRDIDDLVVSDEEESNYESRPSSSASAAGTISAEKVVPQEQEVDETYVSEMEENRMSPGGKERGSAQEYPEEQRFPEQQYPEQQYEEDEEEKDITEAPLTLSDLQPSPAPPPKSPLRKSITISPMPSPINIPTKPQHTQRSHPPSPLRKPLQVSVRDENIPPPIPSPTRSHRKTLSSEKRMRKSIPLPDPNTPEAIRLQSQIKASPSRPTSNLRRSQYEHLMKTPQTQNLTNINNLNNNNDSPFLIPRDIIRLSISPPPADISFAHTPRQDISFSVTTKVLVKHLTDFEPFEPYWENLRYIDFRGKGVTALDGLKSFCPKLEELDIKDCKVKYLTGLPSTMKILKANGNRLDGLVSFAWARNLQYLDLANNQIDSLAGYFST